MVQCLTLVVLLVGRNGDNNNTMDAGYDGDGDCDNIHVGVDVNCKWDEVVAVVFMDDILVMTLASGTGNIYTDVCLFINTGDWSDIVIVGAVEFVVVDKTLWWVW